MVRFSVFPCFPSSKHPKIIKSLNKTTSLNQANIGSVKTLVSKWRVNSEDQGSGKLGDLVQLENAKEREDEKNKESVKLGVLVEIETENERKEAKESNLGDIENESGAGSGSSVSGYISYPPMHRYHNCVTHEEDEEHVLIQEDSPESLFSLSIYPSRQSNSCPVDIDDKEVNDSLLNPIENLAERKTMKARPMPGLDHLQEKENLYSEQEEICKPSDRKGRLKNDTEKSATSSKEESQTSWKSIEDRPILGAWSIDEVKQISARSTPRKSPCHNPDDTPIIGTVGSYWSHTGQATDSSNSCMSSLGTSAKSSRNRKNQALSCHSSSKRRLERAFDKSVD